MWSSSSAPPKNQTKKKKISKEGRGSRRLVQVVFLFVAKFVFLSLVRSSSSSISSTTAPPAGCTTTTTTAPLLQLRNKGMILSSRTFRPEESDAETSPLFLISFSVPPLPTQALVRRGRLIGPWRLRPPASVTPGRPCRGGAASELS